MTLKEEAVKGAVAGVCAGAVIGIAGYFLVEHLKSYIGEIWPFKAAAVPPVEMAKDIYID